MHLILLGYRASGKTSVGRRLASELALPFADVDQETCRRIGCFSIAQIWNEHGEAFWRHHEVLATEALCRGPDHVISLGGGTLMQPRAHAAVLGCEAFRVYLHCEPEEILRRISRDKTSGQMRPNLTTLQDPPEDPPEVPRDVSPKNTAENDNATPPAPGGGLAEIKAVLAHRLDVYGNVADRQLDVTELTIDQVVDQIMQYWRALQ